MKKRNQNSGQGENNILQNRFTAYVEKSLYNYRISYIAKQARHTVVDLYDDITKLPEEIDHTTNSDMLDLVYGAELDTLENTVLYSALRKLESRDLAIVKLHVIYEYTYQQIAVIMGMTMPAVRSRYNRAIKQIRRSMEGSK